jgi:cytochrome b involved in lipid metabolism
MSATKIITRAEVAKHSTEKDLWMVIHGKVYDVTAFTDEHPGGVDTLTDVGGADGTADFDNVGHSESAKQQLKKFLIGELPEEEKKMKIKKQSHDASSSSNVAIAFVVVLVAVVLFLILQK